MTSINTIYLLLLIFCVFNAIKCYYIGSRCGYPGLPHDTQIYPDKTVYEDGDEVNYSCPYDKIYVKTQTKKCVAGVWLGPRSTCGYFIKNQLMNVKVINLRNNKTIVDMITSNYSTSEYPACYYDGNATAVMVPNAQVAHDWHF